MEDEERERRGNRADGGVGVRGVLLHELHARPHSAMHSLSIGDDAVQCRDTRSGCSIG